MTDSDGGKSIAGQRYPNLEAVDPHILKPNSTTEVINEKLERKNIHLPRRHNR